MPTYVEAVRLSADSPAPGTRHCVLGGALAGLGVARMLAGLGVPCDFEPGEPVGLAPVAAGGLGGWRVSFEDGTIHRYAGVIACARRGTPRIPQAAAAFDGPVVHVQDLHGPVQVAGRRAIVLGPYAFASRAASMLVSWGIEAKPASPPGEASPAAARLSRLQGRLAELADGSRLEVDLVVCTTGTRVDLPYIDRGLLEWEDGWPKLVVGTLPPDLANLYLCGFGQPTGRGGRLVAELVVAQRMFDHPLADELVRWVSPRTGSPTQRDLRRVERRLRSLARGRAPSTRAGASAAPTRDTLAA